MKNKKLLQDLTLLGTFVCLYVVTVMSIMNNLGTHIKKGYSASGEYIPHDYYTGTPTTMPFKIAASIVTFCLLIMTVRMLSKYFSKGAIFLSLVILVVSTLIIVASVSVEF